MLNFDKSGKKKEHKRSAKKNAGFFAAIGLCCAAVCLAGISTMITENREKKAAESGYVSDEGLWTAQESVDILPASGSDVVAANTDGVSDTSETSTTIADEAAQTTTTTTTAAPVAQSLGYTEDEAVEAAKKLVFDPPLPGAIIKGFSGTELVYCATMSDWRVHRGVDIAGEAGCEVYSAADGRVASISDDPLYGMTVAVTHSDGSVLYYCGLSDTLCVNKGQKVQRGEQLGWLGDIPCESNDAPHLHLELFNDGEYLDPTSLY